MNADPLISVLIPAYNHEKYVGDCVRSVIGQDYPRMELLMVDDGSSDGTWQEIQRLAEEARNSGKFKRVEIATQENRGVCETLNRLCSMAQGDVVAVIDSDDMYLPGAFQALIKPLLEDEVVGFVVGQNEIIDGEGRRCYWDKEQNAYYNFKNGLFETYNQFLEDRTGIIADSVQFGQYESFIRKGNYIANGFLIRKSYYDKVLPYHKEAPVEDFWLHLQLSKICKYRSIDALTLCYRWHATNTMKRSAEKFARMGAMTYQWEYDNVLKSGDEHWIAVMKSAFHVEKVIFSLWGLLELRCVKDFDLKRRFLSIGKWQFMYSQKKLSR